MKTPITVLFCSILLTFSYECLAQPNSWELILPGSYNYINNDSKGNIYASSLSGHIIKSMDNGVSWDTIFTSGMGHNVFIDTNYIPNDRIILDGWIGIDYLSTDYGGTWEEISPPNLWFHRFTSVGDIISLNPGYYNIYRSTDNGVSWDTLIILPNPSYHDYLLSDIAVDIFNNIYIVIHYNRHSFPPNTWDEVYKSTDNGNTWSLFYESGSGYADRTKIYTTSTADFFVRDQNRGTTLHYLLNGEIHTYSFTAISPWQNTYGHIYLITPFGIPDRVFFSSDLGNSWLEVTSGLEALNLQHSVFCHDTLGYLFVNVPYEQNIGIYKTTFSTERIFDKSVIDFGDVKLYDTTHIQVALHNPFDFAIQIDSVVSYNDQFFISDLQTNILPAEDSITATIAYNPIELDTTESYLYLFSEFVDARIRVIGIGQNPSSIENNQNIITEFSLSQNYPNPFNPTTTIKYQIPESGLVTLKVYDILGNEVATLVNEEKPAGSYRAELNGSNLSSGIYYYRMRAGEFVGTKKMILLK